MPVPFAVLLRAIGAVVQPVYQNPTILLLHLDGDALDAGPHALTTDAVGVLYTSENVLSGQGAYFSASTSGIYVTSDQFYFADDFCIEGFWRYATNIGSFVCFAVYTVVNAVIYPEFEMRFITNASPKTIGVNVQSGNGLAVTAVNGLLPGSYATNARHHWAFYRLGDTYYVAVNGVVAVATAQSGRRVAGQRIFRVGNSANSGGNTMGPTQPLDEIRVTRGTGQIPYGPNNFSPPSAPFSP